MNKAELVEAMANKTGMSKAATESAVKAFVDVVTDELNAETKIAACTAPKFKAGQALKDQVNSKKSKK